MRLTYRCQGLFNSDFLPIVFQFYKLLGSGNSPGTYNDEFVTVLKFCDLPTNILNFSPRNMVGFLGKGIGSYFLIIFFSSACSFF